MPMTTAPSKIYTIRDIPRPADMADYLAQIRAVRDLYAAYKVWCEDNAENPLSPKSFSGFIAQNADAYRLEATNNVYIGSHARLPQKTNRPNKLRIVEVL